MKKVVVEGQSMNRILKHCIAGLIWAVILIAALIILTFVSNGAEVETASLFSGLRAFISIKNIGRLLLSIIVIPLCGSIGYTVFKLWTEWLYSHFAFFGKNVVIGYLLDKFVMPLLFCVLGMVGGTYLLLKIGVFGAIL